MSLEHYYRILGLDEDASDEQVKKRYRTLAKKMHPDHNTSHNAKDQFIKIHEAYEIILNREILQKNSSKTDKKNKSKEERVKEARKRYYEQIRKEEIETERYFIKLTNGKSWKIIRFSSYFGLFLSFLIIIDFFLPKHFESDKINFYDRDITQFNNSSISKIQTENKYDFYVKNIDYYLYSYYPEIQIERSWILHQAIKVHSFQKVKYKSYEIAFTFRNTSFIIIPLFLIPLFCIMYKRKTILFTIIWIVSLYVSFPLMIYFILANHHWAHILSLGFL